MQIILDELYFCVMSFLNLNILLKFQFFCSHDKSTKALKLNQHKLDLESFKKFVNTSISYLFSNTLN